MTIKYSIKENKSLKKKHYNTESMVSMSKINDFCFSINREKDWANIITSHECSDRPSLWLIFFNILILGQEIVSL